MKREWSGNGLKLGRRRFLGASLGLGVSSPFVRRAESSGRARPEGFASTGGVEAVPSRTDRMDVLGRPRNRADVRDGFHPFAPQRVGVWPSASGLAFDGFVPARRREIDREVEREWSAFSSAGRLLPEDKRESIYRMIDRWAGHYDRPDLFEPWVLGLVGREALGSTALGEHVALAHQYNSRARRAVVGVDCPPVDWWLFLFPDGIDWDGPDGKPTHAILGHVGRTPWHHSGGLMYRVWSLGQTLFRCVEDWARVGRMGRSDAAGHLNRAVSSILGEARP